MKKWLVLFVILLTADLWAQEPESLGITADRSGSASPSAAEEPTGVPSPAKTTEEEVKVRLRTVVSLSFTQADLRNVLNGLAKTYGLNIVADDKVKGTVNLTLKGVTLEEALQQILRLNGFTFMLEGSILKIVSLEEQTVTELLTLNFIQPDTAMEFLKAEATETGVMKVDETQNGIIVSDKISKLEAMKKILEKIDVPPQQVLIQARLLDITHTDLDNLGLKLSSVSFVLPLRGGGLERGVSFSSTSLDLAGPSADLTTDTITATIAKGPETMTATLDALIRDKRVKVLASPTVATLNNVEAKITIGEKFPIQETTQTTTGTLQTTRFVDVGITLRVTPKINRAGFVQMQIHPEVSSVASTIDAGPRITTREADTTVIIKERESVVIAGLIKEEETAVRDRIPILGHIPWLGLLFQNRSKTYEQKELVIVITPYLLPVIPPQTTLGSEVEEAKDRLEAMELYRQAQDFEYTRSLQARQMPDSIRHHRAAELYELLADRFPRHPFAPEALFRAGDLRLNRLKDPFHAEELWTRLMMNYPRHPYAQSAQRRIKELQNAQASRGRKREGKKEQTRQVFVSPGFH